MEEKKYQLIINALIIPNYSLIFIAIWYPMFKSFSSILTNRLLPYPVTQYNDETEDLTNDLNTLATLIAC